MPIHENRKLSALVNEYLGKYFDSDSSFERVYDYALKEYQNTNEDGKSRLVYAYFGLAIYYGQSLETTFGQMLWMDRVFKQKVKIRKEVEKIFDDIENSRKTMGVFINEIKQNYELTDDITEQLDRVLKKRNYLSHSFFKINITKFYSDIGKKEMIEYCCNFIDETKFLDGQLAKYSKLYMAKLGITKEHIEQIISEMEEEEIRRVSEITMQQT